MEEMEKINEELIEDSEIEIEEEEVDEWAHIQSEPIDLNHLDKIDINTVSFCGKPVKDMTIEELKRERALHGWASRRFETAALKHTMRLHHLRNNYPVYTKEEVNQAYENGEIDWREKGSRMHSINARIQAHERAESQIIFGVQVADHHKAMAVYLGEMIKIKEARIRHPVRGTRKKYNPYIRACATNPRPWESKIPGEKLKPKSRIVAYRKKWNEISKSQADTLKSIAHTPTMKHYDRDAFTRICYAKGYTTPMLIAAAVAQAVGITIHSAMIMVRTGDMTFDNVLKIGAEFEMTPAEFCDSFLHGYFQEYVDGKWVATLKKGDNRTKKKKQSKE